MEMASERANSEVNVYGAVGAVFLFLMVALLLGLSFNSPCKSNEKYLPTSDREQVSFFALIWLAFTHHLAFLFIAIRRSLLSLIASIIEIVHCFWIE